MVLDTGWAGYLKEGGPDDVKLGRGHLPDVLMRFTSRSRQPSFANDVYRAL